MQAEQGPDAMAAPEMAPESAPMAAMAPGDTS